MKLLIYFDSNDLLMRLIQIVKKNCVDLFDFMENIIYAK